MGDTSTAMAAKPADSCTGVRRRLAQAGFLVACTGTTLSLAFLYTWRLEQSPPYLNQDEAGMGLASYLLATTGRDYVGNPLPVFVACFDNPDLDPAMLSYWAIPFVDVMGLSVLSLRLSVAALGLLTLLLFAIVSWRSTGSRWLGLVSAWLLAMTPLFLIQSRLFMQLLAITFVIAWLGCINEFELNRDRRYLLAAALVLGLGSYSYTSTRLLMPLYLAAMLAVYYLTGDCSWKTAVGAAAIFALLMLPMIAFATAYPGLFLGRFRSTTWFNPGTSLTTVPATYLAHYLAHFDPIDLFVSGDESLIHSTGRVGVFLPATIPLALVGVVSMASHALRRRSGQSVLMLLALLLFPVPTALLADFHRPYRSLYLVALYGTLCIAGIRAMVARAGRSRLVAVALAGVVLWWSAQAFLFLQDYYGEYPARMVAAGYSNGNKPMAFRAIMRSGVEDIYLDEEDFIFPTYVRFFQVAYGYKGAIHLVQPSQGASLPAGALLLTKRPKEYGATFEEVEAVPELARGVPHYSILRQLDQPG